MFCCLYTGLPAHRRRRSHLTEYHTRGPHARAAHAGSHLARPPHAPGPHLLHVLLPVHGLARHTSLAHALLELLVRHAAAKVVWMLLKVDGSVALLLLLLSLLLLLLLHHVTAHLLHARVTHLLSHLLLRL